MNKIKTLFFTVLCSVVSIGDAISATTYKCANMTTTSTCYHTFVSMDPSRADWILSCNGSGSAPDGTPVNGIAGCSYQPPSGGIGSTAENVTYHSTTVANDRYCWCMAVTPFTSKWVYSYDFGAGNGENCHWDCARQCYIAMSASSNAATVIAAILNPANQL